ncbi:MAG: NAD-dependent protein deacylase, partial [Calditrichaeota bacterium]|nr:NAD-dependent protein deacylase [Calditrichota bacterium]
MNLLKRLQSAYSVVVLSGAGMSAASGIPTFRGRDGLWNQYRPEELATMEAFRRNPQLVWEWYCWRRDLIRGAKPNAGHLALAEMERYFPEFAVITQNVDNLHQTAGTRNITELHGNIMRNLCINTKCSISSEVLDREVARMGKTPARCPECGSLVRPGVVW